MYILWSKLLTLLYPSFQYTIPGPPPGQVISISDDQEKVSRKVRLGVISEPRSNSSPLLCFAHILSDILSHNILGYEWINSTTNTDFELVYFGRLEDVGNKLHYEQLLKDLAINVYYIPSNDLKACAYIYMCITKYL